MSRGSSRSRRFTAVTRRSLLWSLDIGLVAALFLAVFIGPRVIDGRGQVAWATFHAARRAVRPTPLAEAVHKAGRAAVLALEWTAPLPYGKQAARIALELAQSAEAKEPAAALEVYRVLRAEIELLETSPIRRLGVQDLAADVRRLEAAARAREPQAEAGP